MNEPEPKKTSAETKFLGVVIGILVVLYVGMTAFIMRINQKIGTTQLGYSALHTTQLKDLHDKAAQLSATVAEMKEHQEDFAAATSVRLNRLETGVVQLSNAQKAAETDHQSFATATAGKLDGLQTKIGALQTSATAVERAQGTFGTTLNTSLGSLQNQIAAVNTAVGKLDQQQAQLSSANAARLDQLQKDVAAFAASQERGADVQFLSRHLDQLMLQCKKIEQVTEENLTTAAQTWRQARLVLQSAATEPSLADKVNLLNADATRIQTLLANAVAPIITNRHKAALAAANPDEAAALMVKAEEMFALFPMTNDPALVALSQKLAADHDAVRQKLIAAKTPAKK